MTKVPASGQKPAKQSRARSDLKPLWESEARSGPKMEARAYLLEAAARAFMERGYSGTTLDHVAAQMGMTKGQIYHYYRSKMDLYFDVVVGAFFMINDATVPIAQQEGVGPAERLRHLAKAYARTAMATFPFQKVALEATQHQLIAQMSPRQDRAMTRILRFRDDFEAMLADLIRQGIEVGEFQVRSVPFAAKAVVGSLNWLTIWFDPKKSNATQSREDIAQGLADFVVEGLIPKQFDGPLRP